MNTEDNPAFDRSYHACEFAPDERPTEAVVRAVATVTNRDPTSVEPLASVIDADALDDLFGREGDDQGVYPRVGFDHAGCDVVVAPDRVWVRPPATREDG